MVHNSWLRPKTSSGLPTANNNDSSIHANSLQQPPSARRATQEYLSRPSFGPETLLPSRKSTTDLYDLSRSSLQSGHIRSEGTFRFRVQEVKSMVRKALQGSRDMRPTPDFSTNSPTMNSSPAAQSSRPPSTHNSGRIRQRESSAITRPLSRLGKIARSRRGAFSFRSTKGSAIVQVHNGTPLSDLLDSSVSPRSPPVELSTMQPQILPPGAAARASAANHKKANFGPPQQLFTNPQPFQRTDTMMTRQFATPDNGQKGYDEITECRPTITAKKFIDPVKCLPTEISAIILAYLDDAALCRAQRVSRAWHEIASSSAVWRSAFLGHYSRRPSNTQPYIQMGGAGLGDSTVAQKQWQQMAKARKEIDKNWSKGKPKAIYFSGHTDSVYCCQFDEDKIITGSRDRTVRVWDLNWPYKCRKVIGGPAARPTLPNTDAALDVHPENTVHNAPSVNGTDEGDRIFHVPEDYHSASILCLQFDDEIMVTGSSDSTCIVWDIKTYQPIHRLRHHTAGVLDVCFDEKYIISCSKDATICVWSRETGELIKVLAGHKGPVNAVQLRQIMHRKLLVSASGDGFSKLWCLARLEEIKRFESQDRGLAAVEYSDDGRYVLAGGNDQVIYKYDVATGNCILTYKGHTNLVRSLFLDSANGRVLSGSYDQGIRVFNFEDGRDIGVYDNWTTSWILAAKSDYRRIVATSQDGRALLMDFGHGVDGVNLLAGRNGR